MEDLTIISADSHMIEPPDLWVERLDKKYRDQAPHTVRGYAGQEGEWFVVGNTAVPATTMFGTGIGGADLPEFFKKTFDDAPASVWDPAERLKEQDVDGIKSEVLFTSFGLLLYSLDDTEFRRACFRVYNDYVGEYCSYDRNRLVGVGMVDLEDIPAAVAELKHCADKGLKGVMIWSYPPPDRPYSHPDYEPFWVAAEDLGIVLTLHIHTAYNGTGVDGQRVVSSFVTLPVQIMQSLTDMIVYGVFERHPKLRVISAENDCSWIPNFMYRLDHYYNEFRFQEGIRPREGRFDERGEQLPELSMPASEYLKRNVAVTFQNESGERVEFTRHFLGAEALIWGSDYPHSDGTWPRSREIISETYAAVSKEDIQKMVAGNIARIYDIELN